MRQQSYATALRQYVQLLAARSHRWCSRRAPHGRRTAATPATFREQTFPGIRTRFQDLVREGQHPTILFIGCSDSPWCSHMLTGTGPGELFIVRNVGAFVPPHDGSAGCHGNRRGDRVRGAQPERRAHRRAAATVAASARSTTARRRRPPTLAARLELGREAVLPVQVSPEALRRTEQRAAVLQLERLMDYLMVRARQGRTALPCTAGAIT